MCSFIVSPVVIILLLLECSCRRFYPTNHALRTPYVNSPLGHLRTGRKRLIWGGLIAETGRISEGLAKWPLIVIEVLPPFQLGLMTECLMCDTLYPVYSPLPHLLRGYVWIPLLLPSFGVGRIDAQTVALTAILLPGTTWHDPTWEEHDKTWHFVTWHVMTWHDADPNGSRLKKISALGIQSIKRCSDIKS